MEWLNWSDEDQKSLPFDVEFEGHPPEIAPTDESSPPPLAPIEALSRILGERRFFSAKLLFGGSTGILPALPGLHIKGFGLVGLPLTDMQAKTLKQFAFLKSGRDRNVHRIDGKLVQLDNPDFAAGLDTIKTQIATRIGCPDIPLELRLQEMMLMEATSMVAPREGCKAIGHVFGWLFVQLPSKHIGGELHMTWTCLDDTQQEFALDMGATTEKAAFHTHFAFFFIQAGYTFTPVTDGVATFLVYNVFLPQDAPILALLNARDKERLVNLLRSLLDTKEGNHAVLFLLGEYPQEAVAARGEQALSGIDLERVMFLSAANKALERRFVLALTFASRNATMTGRRTENDGITWTPPKEDVIVYGEFWRQLDGESTNVVPQLKLESPANLLNPDEMTLSQLWGDKGVHRFEESPVEDADVVKTTSYTRLVLVLQPETSIRGLTFDNIFTVGPTESELTTLLETHRGIAVADRREDGPKAAKALIYIVRSHLATLFPLFLATFEATAFEDLSVTENKLQPCMGDAWILFFKSPMWRGAHQLFMDALKRHARVTNRALHLAVISAHKNVPHAICRALLQIVLDDIPADNLHDPQFMLELWRTVLRDGSKKKIERLRFVCLQSLSGEQLTLVLNAILAPGMRAAFRLHKATLLPILERRSEWLRTQVDSVRLPDGWDADMPPVFLPGQEKTEALLRDLNNGLGVVVRVCGYPSAASAAEFVAGKKHLDKFLRMGVESKEDNHAVLIHKTPELVEWQKRKTFIDELTALERHAQGQSPAEEKSPNPEPKKIKTEENH